MYNQKYYIHPRRLMMTIKELDDFYQVLFMDQIES